MYAAQGVGLDSEKWIVSEKRRKERETKGKKSEKRLLSTGKVHIIIIKFNYLIGIRILQYDKLNAL